MAKWQTLTRQADSLQTDAEDLYTQAEDARCPQLVRLFTVNDGWGHRDTRWGHRDTRCVRDTDHAGVHHVENDA